MEDVLMIAILNIPTIICLIAAIFLCAKEKDGWGWFLFLAFLLIRFPIE